MTLPSDMHNEFPPGLGYHRQRSSPTEKDSLTAGFPGDRRGTGQGFMHWDNATTFDQTRHNTAGTLNLNSGLVSPSLLSTFNHNPLAFSEPSSNIFRPALASPPALSPSPNNLSANLRSTLWWGELEPWMDEEYGKQVSGMMGWDPVEIRIPHSTPDPITGQQPNNPGHCFITFSSPAHAAAALAQITNGGNSAPISMPNSSKPFVLNWANAVPDLAAAAVNSALPPGYPVHGVPQYPKEYSIFVGDLAPETSNSDLVAVFRNPVLGLRNDREPKFIRPFLSCKSAKIMLDPVTGVSRGYGFVRFTDEADQQRALIEMHGLYCLSRPMRISPATAKFKAPPALAPHDLPQVQHYPTVVNGGNQPVTIALPFDLPQPKTVGPTPVQGTTSSNSASSLNSAFTSNSSLAGTSSSSSGGTLSSVGTSSTSFTSGTTGSAEDMMNLPNSVLVQIAQQYAASSSPDGATKVTPPSVTGGHGGGTFNNAQVPSSVLTSITAPIAHGGSGGGSTPPNASQASTHPLNQAQSQPQNISLQSLHQLGLQQQQPQIQSGVGGHDASSPVGPRYLISEESWKHHAQARAILGNLIGPNGEQLTSTDPYNTTVFVGGLSPLISEDTLRSFFAPFGDIHYVKVPIGKHCGFVQFVRKIDAERAIEKLQGFPIGGSRIRLSWGRSQYKAAQAAAQAAQTAALQAQYTSQALGQPPQPSSQENAYKLNHEQALQLLQKLGLPDYASPTTPKASDSSSHQSAQHGHQHQSTSSMDATLGIGGLGWMNPQGTSSGMYQEEKLRNALLTSGREGVASPSVHSSFESYVSAQSSGGHQQGQTQSSQQGGQHRSSMSSTFSPFSPDPNMFHPSTGDLLKRHDSISSSAVRIYNPNLDDSIDSPSSNGASGASRLSPTSNRPPSAAYRPFLGSSPPSASRPAPISRPLSATASSTSIKQLADAGKDDASVSELDWKIGSLDLESKDKDVTATPAGWKSPVRTAGETQQ